MRRVMLRKIWMFSRLSRRELGEEVWERMIFYEVKRRYAFEEWKM